MMLRQRPAVTFLPLDGKEKVDGSVACLIRYQARTKLIKTVALRVWR